MPKEKTKHFTARDVPESIIKAFDTLKAELDKTSPELFAFLVSSFTSSEGWKVNVNVKELEASKTVLEKEIEQLKGICKDLHTGNDLQVERVNTLLAARFSDDAIPKLHPADSIDGAISLLIECLNEKITFSETLQQEMTAHVERSKTAVQLVDHQFICTLNSKVAENARKCRSVIIKQGLIDPSDPVTDPHKFPSDLANLAIHNLLVDHFSEIISE